MGLPRLLGESFRSLVRPHTPLLSCTRRRWFREGHERRKVVDPPCSFYSLRKGLKELFWVVRQTFSRRACYTKNRSTSERVCWVSFYSNLPPRDPNSWAGVETESRDPSDRRRDCPQPPHPPRPRHRGPRTDAPQTRTGPFFRTLPLQCFYALPFFFSSL